MALLELVSLPGEIIDHVIDKVMGHARGTLRKHHRVDLISLFNLALCSRALHERIRPLLYRTEDARNAALRHGCLTGNTNTIRRAVAGGANPSVVRRHFLRGAVVHADNTPAKIRELFSLFLALRSNHLEAFRLFLELGAELKALKNPADEFGYGQLRDFTMLLSQSQNVAFLESFVAAHAGTPHEAKSRSQLNLIIKRPGFQFVDIVLFAPDDLIKSLLRCGVRDASEAVSAACSRGDLELFDILVSNGAPITAPSVLMAISYLGRTGNNSMVEACLAGGGRIPEPSGTSVDTRFRHLVPEAIAASPILVYLNSVPAKRITGPDTTLAGRQNNLSLYEGLVYLVDTLGTPVPRPEVIRQSWIPNQWIVQVLRGRFSGMPSPVEVLLKKHGLDSLESTDFLDTVKFLIERGDTGSDLASFLLRIDGSELAPTCNGQDINVGSHWQTVLAHLQPSIDALSQPEKNTLLRRIIVEKGAQSAKIVGPNETYGQWHEPPRTWARVQAIGRITIRALISAGAEINHIAECTPLHQLIKNLIHIDEMFGTFLVNHQHNSPKTAEDFVESFSSYLSFLVGECGADPLIAEKTGDSVEEESTAITTLEWELRRWRGGVVGNGLTRFVAVLKGRGQASCSEETRTHVNDACATDGKRENKISQATQRQTQHGTKEDFDAAEGDEPDFRSQLAEVEEVEEVEWNLGALI